jgi:lipid A 3-O-deacylase
MCLGKGLPGRVGRCVAAAFLLLSADAVRAEEFRLESVGTRFAFSSKKRNADMYQTDLTLNANLPWRWHFNEHWSLQTRLDSSAGWLTGHGDDAGVFNLTPSFVLHRQNVPVSLVAGSGPVLLTKYRFDGLNLGMQFQFATYAGLDWNIGTHFRLGYQFQHMSNAGLASPNPGVNFHFFAVSYRF